MYIYILGFYNSFSSFERYYCLREFSKFLKRFGKFFRILNCNCCGNYDLLIPAVVKFILKIDIGVLLKILSTPLQNYHCLKYLALSF